MKKFLIASLLGLASFSANAALLELNTDNAQDVQLSTLAGFAGWLDLVPGGAPDPGDMVYVLDSADIASGEGLFSLWSTTNIDYEYLGKEASWRNSFFDMTGTIFQTASSSVGDTYSQFQAVAGKLDFGFSTAHDSESLVNATSSTGLHMAIFPEIAGMSYIVMLGDLYGDSDYDDMVVRVSAVPVPAAVWLFGSALLGFFGFSRRRSAV